ncbi:tyrosine-type recombinase/integrase [Alphaproteobacteria bacterium LSUCC0226]|jgi:integrase
MSISLDQAQACIFADFHDLRHEAISRMFDSGMKIHEVMAVSGHRTASQLFRYVQVVS